MVLGGNEANGTIAFLANLVGLGSLILKEDSWMEWQMTTVWMVGAAVCCLLGPAITIVATMSKRI